MRILGKTKFWAFFSRWICPYVIHVLDKGYTSMPQLKNIKWETFEILICEKFYWFFFLLFFISITMIDTVRYDLIIKKVCEKFFIGNWMLWLFLAVWDDGLLGEDVLRNLNTKKPLKVNWDCFLRYLRWRQSKFQDFWVFFFRKDLCNF